LPRQDILGRIERKFSVIVAQIVDGYLHRCLAIWDSELKDEQAIVAKVKQFTRRK